MQLALVARLYPLQLIGLYINQFVLHIMILYLSAVFHNKFKVNIHSSYLLLATCSAAMRHKFAKPPTSFPVCRVYLVACFSAGRSAAAVALLTYCVSCVWLPTLPCAAVLSQTQCLTAFVKSVKSSFDYSTMHMHMLAN